MVAFEDFQLAEAALDAKGSQPADLIVAALAQGQAQFPSGTPERKVLDSIPVNIGAQMPVPAVTSIALSPQPGRVHRNRARVTIRGTDL